MYSDQLSACLEGFGSYLRSHCGEQSKFPSLGHTNHIDFHALFMLGGLEPNVCILWKASFGARTTSEYILSHFTPAVCSSERRQFSCMLEYF